MPKDAKKIQNGALGVPFGDPGAPKGCLGRPFGGPWGSKVVPWVASEWAKWGLGGLLGRPWGTLG